MTFMKALAAMILGLSSATLAMEGARPAAFAAAVLGRVDLLQSIQAEDFSYDSDEDPTPDPEGVNGTIEFQGEAGMSPLAIALKLGHLDVAHGLLELGAHFQKVSLIQRAIENGDLLALESLRQVGAKFDYIEGSNKGQTYLMFAVERCPREHLVAVADFLIENNVNLWQRDTNGDSALHYASRLWYKEQAKDIAARLLARAPALKNFTNNRGQKPRMIRCFDDDYAEIDDIQ